MMNTFHQLAHSGMLDSLLLVQWGHLIYSHHCLLELMIDTTQAICQVRQAQALEARIRITATLVLIVMACKLPDKVPDLCSRYSFERL